MDLINRIENQKYSDFPNNIHIQDYAHSQEQFLNYFQSHSAVSAIYQIGSINDPGISDLDLIIVTREGMELKPGDIAFMRELNKEVFVHPPFIVSESIFSNVIYLFFISNPQRLSGNSIDFCSPPHKEEMRELLWIINVEAAVSRLSDLVYQSTIRSELSMRNMLLKLNSIRHNIALHKQFLGEDDSTSFPGEADDYCHQISTLRSSWFSYQSAEQVEKTHSILKYGIDILFEIISQSASPRSGISLPRFEGRDGAHYLMPGLFQVFKFEHNQKGHVRLMRNPLNILSRISKAQNTKIARHCNDISIIRLPKSLLPLFPFNQRSLKISDQDRNALKTVSFRSKIGRKRTMLIEEYQKFLSRNGHAGLSPLIFARWQLNPKGKFYFEKRTVLEFLWKTGIV